MSVPSTLWARLPLFCRHYQNVLVDPFWFLSGTVVGTPEDKSIVSPDHGVEVMADAPVAA
jgi:hypothetical protein